MVFFGVLLGIWFVFLIFGIVTWNWDAGAFFMFGQVGFVLLCWFVFFVRRHTMTDEKRRKIEQREFERKERRRPVDAVLISTYLERKSSLGWALLGYWAEGPCGARHGARSGKVIKKAVFSIRYADGHTGTEDVDMESYRFKELSALLLE